MLRHAIGINERAENKSLWKITLGFLASITVNMINVQNSHNEKHLKKFRFTKIYTELCKLETKHRL